MDQAISILNELYDHFLENYRQDKSDFSAGRLDALKSALEVLEAKK